MCGSRRLRGLRVRPDGYSEFGSDEPEEESMNSLWTLP